jgi:hypothetical protein
MTEVADDLELPTDTAPSRIRERGPVTGFVPPPDDPDDITTVDDRLDLFRVAYPHGIVKTKVKVRVDPHGFATYTARAKVKPEAGAYTLATGHASRTEGLGDEPYASRPQETAESTAINRALRFLGIKPTSPRETNDEDPSAEA